LRNFNSKEEREAKEKVKKALQDLEQKHADKVAAIAAERRRQQRLAAEAAARAKREQEARVQAELKRMRNPSIVCIQRPIEEVTAILCCP